jgi:two-component system chemotaxis sensor kinase CheA
MGSGDLLELFVRESEDLTRELEAGLLSLESGEDREETIARIFRAAHTLKGNAGMAGLTMFVRFAHVMENVIDRVRSRRLDIDGDLIELLLRAADVLKQMTEEAGASTGETELDAVRADLLENLHTVLGHSRPPAMPSPIAIREFEVELRFTAGAFRIPPDPFALVAEVCGAGEVLHVELDVNRLPPLAEMDPASCYLSFRVRVRGALRRDDIYGICMFSLDDQDITIREVSSAEPAPAPGPALAEKDRKQKQAQKIKARSSIRVDTDKLDRLVDLVGELVIALSQASGAQGKSMGRMGPGSSALETLLGIGREMQDQVMSLRMVPIRDTFERFRRPVRDVAQELGKVVELEMSGTETELDKKVIDELVDPLNHMVRNSVFHGLETPEERVATGKPRGGTLHLRAAQEEGRILIEIQDDGRGIDPDAVLRKARSLGLVAPDRTPSEREIYDLLFLPGFSTAKQVNEIAGRGVGLDVVLRRVQSLRGTVEVRSQRGLGTTFRIRLPLTLAIVDGMNVRIGAETMSIPLVSIIELLEATEGTIRTIEGKNEFIELRGELLPLVRLSTMFDLTSQTYRGPPKIVVVGSEGRKFGLLVDDVVGMSQAVIKPMEESFRLFRRMDAHFSAPGGVGGATILSDGTVGLVIDVHGLERKAFEA